MSEALENLLSFREIDRRHGRPKGTAFRAFKRLGARLREDRHFRYLDARTHGPEIEALKRAGRLYPTTINAVLMTEAGYALIKQTLEGKEL